MPILLVASTPRCCLKHLIDKGASLPICCICRISPETRTAVRLAQLLGVRRAIRHTIARPRCKLSRKWPCQTLQVQPSPHSVATSENAGNHQTIFAALPNLSTPVANPLRARSTRWCGSPFESDLKAFRAIPDAFPQGVPGHFPHCPAISRR